MFVDIARDFAEQLFADRKRRLIKHHKRHVNGMFANEIPNRGGRDAKRLVFRIAVNLA